MIYRRPVSRSQHWSRVLRPLEWALLAFLCFVLVRAGPQVFVGISLLRSRATTICFALGLVAAIQLFWRFTRLPWAEGAPRRVVWLTLPLALAPFLFSLGALLRSPLILEELPDAEPALAVAALASLLLLTVGIGLPTLFAWLLFASLSREHGGVERAHVGVALKVAASTVRDWLPLLVITSGYEWMRRVVEAGFTRDYDAGMAAIDRLLFFGHDPLLLLEQVIWKPLTELLAFIYSFYAVLYPLVLGTISVTGGRRALRLSAFRVGLALLIAYVGYTLLPVKGPVLTRTFDVPLDMYVIGPIKEAMMDATRISYDCFPSMHTCCTLLLGLSAWTWARRLFWLISPAVALMPLACVYLRYHYVIDLLAGVAVAIFVVWLSRRLEVAIDAQ